VRPLRFDVSQRQIEEKVSRERCHALQRDGDHEKINPLTPSLVRSSNSYSI
jgi:hypothetical protein